MALPAEKIASIRERIDVVDFIGRFVQLTKRGNRYVGLCPFHTEKSPSFSVSAEKGLYYCFGCHAHGDLFSFVMHFEALDFRAAAMRLGKEAGVEFEPESPQALKERLEKERIAQVNQQVHAFFKATLWGPLGDAGRTYLKQRGIPPDQAREFGVGFAPSSQEVVAFLRGRGVSPTESSQAGLTSEDGERLLFERRVVFPIFDASGLLCGFGGRRLGEDGPKYINTRENVLFRKSHLLFGLWEGQQAIRTQRRIILVEGYTDVLAAWRAGLNQAVAVLGTAFSSHHAAICARFAKDLVLMLDADKSGQKAAKEAAALGLSLGMRVLVARLPEGEDPDSLVRTHGPQRLAAAVVDAVPAVEHFIDCAFHQGDGIEERAASAMALRPLLHSLQSGLERDLYTARIAEKVGVSVEQLLRHWTNARDKRPSASRPQSKPAPAKVATNSRHTPPENGSGHSSSPEHSLSKLELHLLRELLLYPQLRSRCSELSEFALSESMRELLDALAESDSPIEELLPQYVKDTAWLLRLQRVSPVIGDAQELNDGAQKTFDAVLMGLKMQHMEAALREVLREIEDVGSRGGDTSELIRRKQSLSRQKLALKRGRAASC